MSRKEREEAEKQFKNIREKKPTKIPVITKLEAASVAAEREAFIFTGITKALGYALKTSVRDHTEQRLVVQEFWHSLNRKGIIRNVLVQELINLTYKEI